MISVLKLLIDVHVLTVEGREFQITGSATRKPREPKQVRTYGVIIVLWQFTPKTSPEAVLVMGRCGWCQSLHMIKKNHKIYGGSVAPPAEAHKTRWRPRWPPKIMSQYLRNYT